MTTAAESASPDVGARPQARRGCLFIVGRAIIIFVIVLVVLAIIGTVYQAVAEQSDANAYSPPGQIFTVAGHDMHLNCMGSRTPETPAVILQAGASAASPWWYWIQNQLAETTQVCAFDRPGMGWSEPVEGSRDASTINAELRDLLAQAGVEPPYVMVGHSFGAILTRIYAAQYPQDISGIVLVDSQILTPKAFATQAELEQNQQYWRVVHGVGSVLTRIGVTRLTLSSAFQGYPPELVPMLVGLQARNQVMDAYYAENGPAFPALQEASALAEDLGELPMIVLWASDTAFVTRANPPLAPLMEELSTYSNNLLTREIDGANHGSILGNEAYARQVSAAVLDVITAAQSGESLAQ